MRLFVAIALPEEIRRDLLVIQPAVVEGLRLVRKDLLHLTLQFIGEADAERVGTALRKVEIGKGSVIRISGVGSFGGTRGMMVLWAGVEPSAWLLGLGKSVADCLEEAGFASDDRNYHPHITLARCRKPKGAENRKERLILKERTEAFLEEQRDFVLPAFAVSGFGLYVSEQSEGNLKYRRLESFPGAE